MEDYKKLAFLPLRQLPNRVWRTYDGGSLIDAFQQGQTAPDGNTPEAWIMSTVIARGNNRPDDEGLSRIIISDEETVLLSDLIRSDPALFLGEKLAEKYNDTGILIKLLDSCERLTIQVHPDKIFAKQELYSEFGKTEGWYILGTRDIPGEDSGYVLMGFQEGFTREDWAKLFREQDIEGMRKALHKIPVKAGNTFIIPGGLPHAIGAGCFLIEIQEPTDYTMRVEKTTPAGLKVSDFLIHQGVGEEKMLDCFHYKGASVQETLSKWQAKPLLLSDSGQVQLYSLLDSRYTDCFSLQEMVLAANAEAVIAAKNTFFVVIVTEGEGSIQTQQGGTTPVKQGNDFFFPAQVGDVEVRTVTGLRLLICLPPNFI
jgi:mannose-6-phosphate isomerase